MELVSRIDVQFCKRIIKGGTKSADDLINIHERLIEKADALLAQYPGAAGYVMQKEDAQKALLKDYRFKQFLEGRIAKAKEMLANSQEQRANDN